MRILLAGKHELAAAIFSALHPIKTLEIAVAPAKSEDVQRTGISMHAIGKAAGVTTFAAEGEPALLAAINAFHPDILLSAGYDRIIKPEVFERVAHRVNIHFGALPRYRGNWSIPCAMLNGDGEIGVTLHQISAGIDDGAIIELSFVEDNGTKSCRDLYDAAVERGAEMAKSWILKVQNGEATSVRSQDENLATYYGRQYPGNFQVDWRQTGLQVMRYIRAAHFPPYRGAHSTIGSDEIEFAWPALFLAKEMGGIRPGTIVGSASGTGIAVLNGIVLPSSVTFEGKTRAFSELAAERQYLGQTFE